jgi:Ankyrin repeats (3 copies)/Ankyrin repeat
MNYLPLELISKISAKLSLQDFLSLEATTSRFYGFEIYSGREFDQIETEFIKLLELDHCEKIEKILVNITRKSNLPLSLMRTFDLSGIRCGMLHAASERGYLNLCRIFIQKSLDVNIPDATGSIALHEAAFFGFVEICELLILNKADLDKSEADGWTPLSLAARNGHIQVCELLIQKGARVDAGELTPLQVACMNGHLDIVKLLVGYGALLDTPSEYGNALGFAIDSNQFQIFQFLVKMGADTFVVDTTDGSTLLHFAAFVGSVEICQFLIAIGLDPLVQNNIGERPFDVIGSNYEELMDLLDPTKVLCIGNFEST